MIEHMIEAAAAAQVELDEAQAVHAKDCAEVARLAGRIEQCQARQAEITAKRLLGKSTPEEAAEFAALGGDIDVLAGLLADAKASAAASRPDRLRSALAHAQSALVQAQAQAEFALLVEHAREVERAYVDALDRVWKAALENGHRRTFGEAFSIDPAIMTVCRQNYWSA